jgi:hypothetical protein
MSAEMQRRYRELGQVPWRSKLGSAGDGNLLAAESGGGKMKVTQKVTLGALLALLAAAAVGLHLTSGSIPVTSPSQTSPVSDGEMPSINQRFLDTAQGLASLAATAEEQHAAKNALDAADQELDLEYGYALQLSATEPVPQTAEIRAIQDRIVKLKGSIQTRQDEVNRVPSVSLLNSTLLSW